MSLSGWLYVCLFLGFCIFESVFTWVSRYLFIWLPESVSVRLYVYLSLSCHLCDYIGKGYLSRIGLSAWLSFICLLSHSFCLFVCLIVCVSIGVFISQCVYLYACLFICLPVYLGWHTLSMHRRFWFRSFRACDFNGEVKRWAVINHGVFRDRRFSTNWVCMHVRECVAWWSNG